MLETLLAVVSGYKRTRDDMLVLQEVGNYGCTVVDKSKWHHQVFQGRFHLKR